MEIKTRMVNNEMLPEKFTRLRRQAKERIEQWPSLEPRAQLDLHTVIYELKIHLAELEIQNEELKLAMKEMVARQYQDEKTYDFGPLKEKIGKSKRDDHRVRSYRDEVPKKAS
jgi:hypothetical protein